MAAPTPRRKQTFLRNACVTVNNYDDADIKKVKNFAVERCSYAVVAKEVGASGTPHLQCYFKLKKRARWNSVRGDMPLGAHLEPARGNPAQNAAYCKKGTQSKEEWDRLKEGGPHYGLLADVWEHGTVPSPGRRSDIHALGQAIIGGASLREVVQEYTACAIKYTGGIRSCMAVVREAENEEKLKSKMEAASLRPWQQEVVTKLQQYIADCEDRKIIWVYDTTAGHGKSFLARYLRARHDCQSVPHGEFKRMAYLLDEDKPAVVIDIPFAVKPSDMPYAFMEKVRDGCVFSSMYTPTLKTRVDPWQVVVFSNSRPDSNLIAEDRFDVITIDEDGELVPGPPALQRQNAMGDIPLPAEDDAWWMQRPLAPAQLSLGEAERKMAH